MYGFMCSQRRHRTKTITITIDEEHVCQFLTQLFCYEIYISTFDKCLSYHPSKSPFRTVIRSFGGTENSIFVFVAAAEDTKYVV